MARSVFVGATAAATLPAALAAAVLVSAPFAGTTTSPLAGGFDARIGQPHHAHHAHHACRQPAHVHHAAARAGHHAGLSQARRCS
jgi:hypothetical protein